MVDKTNTNSAYTNIALHSPTPRSSAVTGTPLRLMPITIAPVEDREWVILLKKCF